MRPFVKTGREILGAILILACPIAAHAGNEVEKLLREKLIGHVVALRTAYKGKQLHFDEVGRLQGKSDVGELPFDAVIEVNKVSAKRDSIMFEAERRILVLEKGENKIVAAPTRERLRILVSRPADRGLEGMDQLLLSIFLSGAELDHTLESYWKPAGTANGPPATDEVGAVAGYLQGRPVYTIKMGSGNFIQPPKPIQMKEPEYTEEARARKLTGMTTVLSVVLNEEGVPEVIEIEKTLEAGLDYSSAQAISKWRFKPALKDGKPIAVKVNVEIAFNLY